MTTEPDESETRPGDELTNQWLDAESGDSEFGQSTTKAPEPLDIKQLYRAADVQLVHAMLMGIAEDKKDATQSRVEKLMQAIKADALTQAREKTASPQKPRRYVGPAVKWATAATIIVSLSILLTSLPSNKAMATIDQMIAALENAGDRTYSITVRDQQTGQRERQARGLTGRRSDLQERAGFDGAILYLRGKEQYVLYRHTPSGQTVINGSDGQTNWLIRPARPALVSSNRQAFRIPIPEDLANLLTLDFSATLQQIRERYKIKYLGTVPVGQAQEGSWSYLHATRQNREPRGPRVIRIWAHPDTGLLRRIEFADIHLQDSPGPKKMIIDLTDEKPLPQDWFIHTTHHSEDAEVDYLPQQ